MQKIVILLAAALLLIASGCTSPDRAQPVTVASPEVTVETSATTVATTVPTRTPTRSVDENTISIYRDGFSPSVITVPRGATVRWVNLDSTDDSSLYNPTHRLEIIGVYTSQTLSPGQGWSWVFRDPGSYAYKDIIHTDLQGTVVVE
jgi:plastocyanin